MLYLRAHRPSSDTAAYVWWKGLSEPVNSFTSLLLIAPAIYAAHEGMSHAYSALFCVLSAASFGNHLTHVLGFHLLDYLCITTLHCVVCMDFYRNHSPWRGWRIGVTLALAVYVWMVMNFERVTRRPALDTPNDKLTEERRYADLGEEDGDTIICAMGDTEALRDLEAGWKALKLPVGPVPPLCVSGGFVAGLKINDETCNGLWGTIVQDNAGVHSDGGEPQQHEFHEHAEVVGTPVHDIGT
eukprot:gene5776-6966_t